ncbi:MAG: AraC family transcriptional regulator [Pseudomonadota bacterium]
MTVVARAIWLIENDPLRMQDLPTLAAACGVSAWHLARCFSQATGCSAMAYRRSRLLSQAARRLAQSDISVLSAALEAGYETHEAFSRAFRRQFGCTPESLRAPGALTTLTLTEALRMTSKPELADLPDVDPPRIETLPALKLLGFSGRFTHETNREIPALWQQFNGWEGRFPEEIGRDAYGVCYAFDDKGGFSYLAGSRVVRFDDADATLTRLDIPAQRYAVFCHRGHVSGLFHTIQAVWHKALPAAGLKTLPVKQHMNFERYGADFDVSTGNGVVEYWIPIEAEAG